MYFTCPGRRAVVTVAEGQGLEGKSGVRWAGAFGTVCPCGQADRQCFSSELEGSESDGLASACCLVPKLKCRMCSDKTRIPRRWRESPHSAQGSPEPGHCPLCTSVASRWSSVVSWCAWWPHQSVMSYFVCVLCVWYMIVHVHDVLFCMCSVCGV